jgi:hypothetical protein
VGAPIDIDRLWPSLAAAEKASRRGTELLKELRSLLVRGDPFSETWLEDRCKIRYAIEAHLAAVADVEVALETQQQLTNSAQPAELPSVDDATGNEERVA